MKKICSGAVTRDPMNLELNFRISVLINSSKRRKHMSDWIDEAVNEIKNREAKQQQHFDRAALEQKLIELHGRDLWSQFALEIEKAVGKFNELVKTDDGRIFNFERLDEDTLTVRRERFPAACVRVEFKEREQKIAYTQSIEPRRDTSFVFHFKMDNGVLNLSYLGEIKSLRTATEILLKPVFTS
jgi:hypothetical protein